MLFLAFLLVLFVYIYFKLHKISQFWKDKGVKYVKPTPILGNMYSLMAQQVTTPDFIQNLYNQFPDERYCGIFQLTTPILLLRDPELIRHVTVKNFENFVDHTIAFTVESDPFWSRTLMASTGNRWRDLRHTVSPAFTGSKMRMMFGLIEECAKQMTDYIGSKQSTVVDIEVKDMCERYTNDVIASTAFGIQCDSMKYQDSEFLKVGREYANYTGIKQFKFLLFGYFPTISRLFQLRVVHEKVGQFFRAIITEQIRMRQEKNIVRPDLIHLLLEARKGRLKHEDTKDNESYAAHQNSATSTVTKSMYLSDEDIVSQALIFYLAGYDTTSSLMCAVLHELAVNPHVQTKLREEIVATLEENGGKLTYERLMRMKYMDMVVCEALRKWPQVTWLDRCCTKTFEIEPQNPGENRLLVEKGTAVWIPAYALQHDPQYYPDPEVFDPERFSDENKANIRPYTYLPFGEGPRNCIGNRYGLLSAKVALAHILAKFELVPNSKTMIPLQVSKKSFFFMIDGGCHLAMKRLS